MQTKHQAATNPQTKTTDLGCKSSTPTIAIYQGCKYRNKSIAIASIAPPVLPIVFKAGIARGIADTFSSKSQYTSAILISGESATMHSVATCSVCL